MKENQYCLNTCLTVVLFITLAAAHIARVVAPAIVLPTLNLPNMVLVSVIALLADYYIFPRAPRCYICIPVLSIASFGILPLMAGFACEHNFWKFGLVGGIAIYISVSRNDGAKHAEKLSMSMGASVSDAQKVSKIELLDGSKHSLLNQLMQPVGGVYESTKSAKVQGVTLPEWIIHCDVDDATLGEIRYYNFELLEKNAYGTERKTYLDPASLTAGCTVDQAESILGLEPYAVIYHTDRTETREYRYCYEDGETGNLTAYIITTRWSAEGGMISAEDVRVDFLSQILGLGQQIVE